MRPVFFRKIMILRKKTSQVFENKQFVCRVLCDGLTLNVFKFFYELTYFRMTTI